MRIAVLICSLVFDSQKALMKGIERRVRDCEDICSVFCCHVNITGNDTYVKGEYSIFDLPDFSQYDGVVLVRNTFQDYAAIGMIESRLIEARVPVVCIDSYSPDFVNIISDERANMAEVTRHLVEVHDCKKIYFLGGQPGSSDTVARLKGFTEVLEEHSLDFSTDYIYYGNYEYSSGVEAADYFINLEPEFPDAIVCCNDEMAIGLITELKRRGIKVPKDIKVTGIDFDSVSRIYTPRLTTAKRSQYTKGANAISILHEYSKHMKGETITLPVSLSCGSSCGCKPTEEAKNDATNTNILAIDRYAQSELTQTVKRMTADLMGKHEYYELLDELENYALRLKADELYLCLNVRPDVLIDYSDYAKALALIDRDNQQGYSDDILSVVSIVNGAVPKLKERDYFERKDSLFPPVAKGGKPGGTYYFLPIHYMNRNFGYAILGTNGELIRNDFFPNWCTIASNAFENSRKRSVMEQMIAALDRMWIYDTLTGIYNRAGFYKLSENIISEAILNQTPLCVVFLDADGLKIINDQFGHDEGDAYIKGIADVLKDIKHHGEIIMRYGGDEFVLLAAGYDEDDAKLCVSRIENAMSRMSDTMGKEYRLDASIGYHITTIDSVEALNELIESADRAMYKNKNLKKAAKKKTD